MNFLRWWWRNWDGSDTLLVIALAVLGSAWALAYILRS